MSIVLIFNNKDPQPWAKSLSDKLPNTEISIYPHVTNPEAITFAVCWKPDKDVLSKFPNMRIIQSVGAAIDHITRTQKLKEGQILTRMVDYDLSNDMWEFVLACVLTHLKNLPFYDQQQKDKNWQPKNYGSIKNTSVSILGLGEIGRHVAEKFAEFGFTVKGWSRSEKNIKNVVCYKGQDEFSSFLANTDYLINLLPFTPETENILNEQALKQINKGGFLINVGRGEHLVEQDLVKVLDAEHLSGALLDVFRIEPLAKEHIFWTHPKIQVTPHIASLTNIEAATTLIAENYKSYFSGKAVKNIVSLVQGY
jgi:glyoxylate/hydroxypyruvate reductase